MSIRAATWRVCERSADDVVRARGHADARPDPRRHHARPATPARPLAAGAGDRVVALALGAAIGYLAHERATPVVVARPALPAPELAPLRRELAEARLAMQLSEARSAELERQIDALNQKLAESQEQLTFVRKAREGRR